MMGPPVANPFALCVQHRIVGYKGQALAVAMPIAWLGMAGMSTEPWHTHTSATVRFSEPEQWLKSECNRFRLRGSASECTCTGQITAPDRPVVIRTNDISQIAVKLIFGVDLTMAMAHKIEPTRINCTSIFKGRGAWRQSYTTRSCSSCLLFSSVFNPRAVPSARLFFV